METSLLDIIGLAERDVGAAQRAAKEVFVPYEPSRFSVLAKLSPFYGFDPKGRELGLLPSGISFTFDLFQSFFVKHSGFLSMGGSVIPDETVHPTDYQLFNLDRDVLQGQPDSKRVSMMMGRVPPWHRYPPLRRYSSNESVDDSVYFYAECGDKKPGLTVPVRGNVPIPRDKPILYLSAQFPSGTPIREKFPSGQVLILVPYDLKYSSG